MAAAQAALAAILAVVMFKRFQESGKFMPAGLVLTLSLAILLVYGPRLLSGATKQHKSH